ncbi:MarR family winged helix-turn-helix transcriptional regulator [Lactobacillus sp. LL6]|uniref:MarR family winged helix-turn-helix transcriptional regulator n=1 Tax=Lactobacillus sp. LL6 TaxID=2596827 RepID=UPI00118595D2|nr:MarR family winged helix-turn-helix transcriptional regulator [Lactobacillus sp. LL6]TSO26292.1 winged helix-turn-helix transcriptional regulator [Lactobacillus sp. LL6]
MDVLSFSTISDFINKEVNNQCGLNVSQMRILLFFDKNNNEKITMGKMAHQMDISLSTLSRQLQQNKTRKLVEVTRSEKDTSKHIHLNLEGLEKVNELKKELCLIEQKIFFDLNKQQQSEFSHELESIIESISC